MRDEGRVVPDIIEKQLYEQMVRRSPIWDKFHPARKPLTRRQRFSGRIRRVRWAIHDRFFDCGCDDD